MTTIAVVHPGAMGTALAAALVAAGHRVVWASESRSAATRARAEGVGLADAGDMAALARGSDVVLSICPPHAAVDVARSLAGFGGLYVDANAIAPATAAEVAAAVAAGGATYVDGAVIGPPPQAAGDARLYLSGAAAGRVAALFAGTIVDVRDLGPEPAAASALKMAYAAWTKGSDALLLAIVDLAGRLGVADALRAEWEASQPALGARAERASASAAAKGWRWAGEMDQIAATFAEAGLPDGFHRAAAEVFRGLR